MAKRYRETFIFCDTEEQARAFCEKQNENRYIRTHHKAHYTPWRSEDGKEKKFVAWFAVKR